MALRGLEVDDRGLAERTGTGTGTARARLGHVLAAFDRADAQAHPAAQATEAPVPGSGRRHMIFLADRPGSSQWPLPPIQAPQDDSSRTVSVETDSARLHAGFIDTERRPPRR